ncbi:MAG: Hsp20/alpha crystallin family protein [Nannocystales bacterium]
MQWKTTPDPFINDFRSLSRQVDEAFRELFPAPKARPARRTFKIGETDEAFSLKAALPGLSPEDLSIEVSDGKLKLSATRSNGAPEGYRAIRRERGSLAFEQSIKLGPKVDPEGIEASFEDGILTVTLPKRAEQKPRQITINAA